MKRNISIIFLGILLFSCATKESHLLTRGESLLYSNPDSSLAILKSIDSKRLNTNEEKAKYALFLSAALDKNYIDICSDSLIVIATSYFSRHGNDKYQMLSWYYNGIIHKNMREYASAVVSFEKAAKIAQDLVDSHHLGLIYRNMASCFNQANNYDAAIEYMNYSIAYFSRNLSDSLYLQHAKYSLAVAYYNRNDYDNADKIIQELSHSNSANVSLLANTLLASIEIMKNDNYEAGINLYNRLPKRHLSFHDYAAMALAYNYLEKPDSCDSYLRHAYTLAKNEADSATIDFTKAKILLNRGRFLDAYCSLEHCTAVQDSLTRELLRESISIAQKDYYKAEVASQNARVAETRKRGILLGLIGFLTAFAFIALLLLHSRKQDQWLKELMAKEALNNQSIQQLSRENASLLSTHYSERIHQIDHISRDYYLSDSKTQKEIVFKQFKEYVGNLSNDKLFYKTLEDDLNNYCDGLIEKLRAQVPSIKGRNLRLIMLFFAGLSYETVAIVTRAQSISSLKMQRSRLRKAIDVSNAKDKRLFLEMLDMKRSQTRKTKNNNANY